MKPIWMKKIIHTFIWIKGFKADIELFSSLKPGPILHLIFISGAAPVKQAETARLTTPFGSADLPISRLCFSAIKGLLSFMAAVKRSFSGVQASETKASLRFSHRTFGALLDALKVGILMFLMVVYWFCCWFCGLSDFIFDDSSFWGGTKGLQKLGRISIKIDSCLKWSGGRMIKETLLPCISVCYFK